MNYSFKVVDPAVEFGNAYDITKVVSLHFNSGVKGSSQEQTKNFMGNLQTLRIQGTANYSIGNKDREAIEVKAYRDAEGTELILVPTVGLLHEDMSGGKHSAGYSLDLVINLAPSDELFLFIKTVVVKQNGNVQDAGSGDTFTVSELEVTNRRF
jgi:hypothetical protein